MRVWVEATYSRGMDGTPLPPGPAQIPDDSTALAATFDDRDGLQGLQDYEEVLEEPTTAPRRDVYDIPSSDDSDVPKLKRTTPLRPSKEQRRQLLRKSTAMAARPVDTDMPIRPGLSGVALETSTSRSASVSPKIESPVGPDSSLGGVPFLPPASGSISDQWLDPMKGETADSADLDAGMTARAPTKSHNAATEQDVETKSATKSKPAIKREGGSDHENLLGARPQWIDNQLEGSMKLFL